MINRLKRVEEMVKREVASIVQSEIEDPGVNDVTITRVEVTSDLGFARVYFTVAGTPQDAGRVAKMLKTYAKFVRGELSRRISLKYIPRLSFREDDDEKKQQAIEDLFRKINMERRENERVYEGDEDEF